MSVLGPLMFLLYMNDISQSIVEAFIYMCADDASLYTMGTNFKQVNDNYLGVDVDENPIWEVCVKGLTRVLSYKLYTLNKASKYMNSTLLNIIYTRSI